MTTPTGDTILPSGPMKVGLAEAEGEASATILLDVYDRLYLISNLFVYFLLIFTGLG